MRVSALLLALSGLSLVWGKPSDCVEGLRTALAEVKFNVSDAEDYWGNLCVKDMIVRSMWIAAKLYVRVPFPSSLSCSNRKMSRIAPTSQSSVLICCSALLSKS